MVIIVPSNIPNKNPSAPISVVKIKYKTNRVVEIKLNIDNEIYFIGFSFNCRIINGKIEKI